MRFLASLFGAFCILALAGFGVFYFVMHLLQEPGPLTTDKTVVIARGESAAAIGSKLEQEGVILSRTMIRALSLMGRLPELKAGEYRFPAHISFAAVIDKVSKGEVVAHKISIPEGWTSLEIYYALMKQADLSGSVTTFPPDGTLLPETYQYNAGDNRNSIIQQMQKAMKETVLEAWALRDADIPLANPMELLTLASIVEKETGLATERPRVAGVFLNRLRQHMPLQSDPTVIYGITQGRSLFTRSLTFDDLKTATAYNTYTIPALPPGPIANPGKAALMAVAKPEKHNFLYFVADGTGGHRFAATLAEHNANVANWRKVQKADRKP